MRVRFLVLFLLAATIANAQTTVTIQPLRMGNLTTFNTSAIPTDYIQVEVGGKYGTYKRMVGDNTTPASDSVLVHTSGSRWKLMASKSPSSTTWSNITGKPTLYTSPAEVRNALSSLSGTNRLDTSAIKNLRGITTESDPLVGSHIKAITTGNIADWNASYRTGAGVKSALEALTGTNRLDASAIKNLASSPEFRVNGTVVASRPSLNLIAGSNTTITGTDNSGANRVDVTISASGGSGGAVTSVVGRTGDVLLSKADVGLSAVNNTSDMNKPVSTLTQAALDQRQQNIQFQENGTNKLGSGGAQQINIAGSGVSSSISGTTLTYNIASSGGMVRHYISPTDYGVDTTGVSDATTALQNMFNANPSGWIVFPKGRYRVNGTLTIISNSTEGNNLVIQGYGAKIITSNAATTPVILFNNCMRVSVYGLQVEGTIDFDGWYFGNMTDCYLKDLRFGNQNLDAFDETYWSLWQNCSIKSTLAGIQIHTGISSDLTEFNQNTFRSCRIWYGNYAFAFYGTESAENVTLDNCDVGYQTFGKLYSQNTLNKANINLIGTYLDDDKGFPYDTKGIIINTPVAGSVPNSANIGSFISDIASQANVSGYNGVRVGQRIPTSGYNLIKNGDIRYGVQEIGSDWTSSTLTSGTGVYGQYIRFVASSATLPKTAEWTAIAAPISGWYSITVIGRNVDSTACVFASVVNGTEVLYNPVKIDDKTRFVVSTGKVYLTQGQVFKLRLYSQINVANTVDIAYVALSYGLTAQLYLPTHPDAISTPVHDNVTNLFEKGDGGTLSPDITSTSNVASVVSSSGEDQTGDGTYIRFNPLTSADFPVIRFTLKTKYLKSAIRAGFVTFTARVKITSGYGSTMVAFGSDSAFVTPAQISTGTWQDWRITRAVPSGATKIQIVVTGAAAGTAKDIAFDAVQINLGKTATQWAMSPHDITVSGGTVTGLTTVTNVSALKAVTTATDGQIVATAGYYTRGDGGHGQYVWNSTSTATADNGVVIQATGVTTGRWMLMHDGFFSLKQYGAKGDGTTNDRSFVQAALDGAAALGVRKVVGSRGDTYIVTSSGSKSFMTSSPTSLAYCIDLPPNLEFDLQGATLKTTSNAVIISNKNAATTTDVNITLKNAVLDGGGTLITNKPFLFFYGVTGLRMENITVQNTTHLVSTFTNLTRAHFDNLVARNVVGNAWQFGLPTSGQDVRDSYIGRVYAYNITPESEPIFPGNPFIANLSRCTIDLIFARNVGSGVKIQYGTKDVQIGTVDLDTTNNVNYNSGLKIQGTSGESVDNVTVGQLRAYNQRGSGLYIEYANNVSIGSAILKNNAVDGSYPDVWLAGTNTSINDVTSIGAGGQGIQIRSDALYYRIGKATIIEAGVYTNNSSGVFVSGSSDGKIEHLIGIDNRATKRMQFVINISSSSCVGYLGTMKVVGLTDSNWLAFQAATNYQFGDIRLTTTQRDNMIAPAAGLKIFNTSTGYFQYYRSGAWANY